MIQDRAFLGVIGALLLACTALTIAWAASMAAMPGMQMPGGWTMSMTWMRLPGQSRAGAAATFLGMWTAMSVTMMLPAIAPTLNAHRRTCGAARALVIALTYFAVWLALGAVVYMAGFRFAEATMRRPALAEWVPLITSATIMAAGVLQFTRWKRRALQCCREGDGGCASSSPAWRTGVALGLRCVQCCAGFTAMLLALGVMDMRAMTLVTLLIVVERLAPGGDRWALRIGALLVLGGLLAAAGAASPP